MAIAISTLCTDLHANDKKKYIEDDFPSLPPLVIEGAGGAYEGEMFTRFLQLDGNAEIDNLYVAGVINNPNQIIDLIGATGFVKIRQVNNSLLDSKLIKFFDTDLSNQVCFDGVKFKQTLYEEIAAKCRVGDIKMGADKSSLTTSTSVPCSVLLKPDIKNYSDVFRQIRLNQCVGPFHQQYDTYCQLLRKSCTIVSREANMTDISSFYSNVMSDRREETKSILNSVPQLVFSFDDRSVEQCCALMAPAFGIPLPDKLNQKVKAVIRFYCKYQHLASLYICRQIQKSEYAKIEYDNVFAFQLGYIPDVLQPFLHRIAERHPYLTKRLRGGEQLIYIVSKPSRKSFHSYDTRFEFRYSFSKLELIIAQNRTLMERLLNAIARTIYHKTIRSIVVNGDYIPSYFVKTTVLWMCETKEFANNISSLENRADLIQIGQEWINFAIEKLSKKNCEHYFLTGVNILESYSLELLQIVSLTLQSLKTIPIFNEDTVDVIDQDNLNFVVSEHDIRCKQIEEERAREEFQQMLLKQFPINRTDWPNLEAAPFLNTYRSSEFCLPKFWDEYEKLFLNFSSDKTEPCVCAQSDLIPFFKFSNLLYTSVVQLKNAMKMLPDLDRVNVQNVEAVELFPSLSKIPKLMQAFLEKRNDRSNFFANGPTTFPYFIDLFDQETRDVDWTLPKIRNPILEAKIRALPGGEEFNPGIWKCEHPYDEGVQCGEYAWSGAERQYWKSQSKFCMTAQCRHCSRYLCYRHWQEHIKLMVIDLSLD
ncbi:unnamed protein product [Didymodactylos carnosus]|uniref:Mab-21-like HhH/H2TH-like domain-containing protein n=1 Tax=Didymodactylos carnosus TaxID=1234261 RepID=A0A8S2NF18_9BILA|nr:unnamed protein product [Didymodactylos carnosus]CAF3994890.1 unnamed protein product [Didymodactylos carnosus]